MIRLAAIYVAIGVSSNIAAGDQASKQEKKHSFHVSGKRSLSIMSGCSAYDKDIEMSLSPLAGQASFLLTLLSPLAVFVCLDVPREYQRRTRRKVSCVKPLVFTACNIVAGVPLQVISLSLQLDSGSNPGWRDCEGEIPLKYTNFDKTSFSDKLVERFLCFWECTRGRFTRGHAFLEGVWGFNS